jgi:hypothetical protein
MNKKPTKIENHINIKKIKLVSIWYNNNNNNYKCFLIYFNFQLKHLSK